jgi:hypothetical protein
MKNTKYRIPPAKIDTIELCKELVAMAGLLEDRRVAEKIYKAVRQLQILDKLASETAPS